MGLLGGHGVGWVGMAVDLFGFGMAWAELAKELGNGESSFFLGSEWGSGKAYFELVI